MAHIEIWRLGSDLLLVAALLYFCFRFLRSPGDSARLGQLESNLRALLKEADSAGKNLHDQLTKRYSSMERLLYDLETAQQSINRTLDQADERRRSLAAANRGVTEAAEPAPPPRRAAPAQEERPAAVEAEPASFTRMDFPERSTASTPAQGLSRRVQKESYPAAKDFEPASYTQPMGALTAVYEAARRMLLAGHDLQTISTKTRIPRADLELMAQSLNAKANSERAERSLEVSSAESGASKHDPRLGVLSSPGRAMVGE